MLLILLLLASVLFIVLSTIHLIKYTNLQGQIKDNCGWEDERVKCYCEPKAIQEREAYYETKEGKIKLELVEDNGE